MAYKAEAGRALGMRLSMADGVLVSAKSDLQGIDAWAANGADAGEMRLGFEQACFVVSGCERGLNGVYCREQLQKTDVRHQVRAKYRQLRGDAILYNSLGWWRLIQTDDTENWAYTSRGLLGTWQRNANDLPAHDRYPTVTAPEERSIALRKLSPSELFNLELSDDGILVGASEHYPDALDEVGQMLVRLNGHPLHHITSVELHELACNSVARLTFITPPPALHLDATPPRRRELPDPRDREAAKQPPAARPSKQDGGGCCVVQ
eukprot:TRINITY_DN25364_c0_g1_i1.p1 TRINITY_DN25364_c0_g1~~TRINITY_DN25364_c0_g1_i1.p1  ORF type:complete len:264 (+),score=99.73 TRINITY_DN25364_c0_g1_i1:256-1047(+)